MYRAASLPPDLLAPSQNSLRAVDLSQIASSSSNSELLHSGDVVEVTIATGLEKEEPISWKLRVADEGTLNVPLVGPVLVGGLQLTSAEQVIHDESIGRGKFVNPNVSVILVTPRTNRVTVVGAVLKPGAYDLPAGNSNLLAAIVAAEGLTEESSTIVEVRHPMSAEFVHNSELGIMQPASFTGGGPAEGPRNHTVDLAAGVDNPGDVYVEDGTTVMVRPRAKQYIFVNGLVRKPDRYELTEGQDLRLLDALALAGGRTLELADKVHVIRQLDETSKPVVIQASVNEAKMDGAANIRLAPGDLVTVDETPLTFVVGTVREFVRFGFTSAIPGF
jgi:polysaccharide export outer membrane protein